MIHIVGSNEYSEGLAGDASVCTQGAVRGDGQRAYGGLVRPCVWAYQASVPSSETWERA